MRHLILIAIFFLPFLCCGCGGGDAGFTADAGSGIAGTTGGTANSPTPVGEVPGVQTITVRAVTSILPRDLPSDDGGATWNAETVAADGPGVEHNLRDVLYLASGTGIVGGARNGNNAEVIYQTQNGGAPWQQNFLDNFTMALVRDLAGTSNIVWACGQGGKLYRSGDSGLTWALMNIGLPVATFRSVDFESDNVRGYALSSEEIYYTDNGAYGWRQGDVSGASALRSVAVVDTDIAVAVGGSIIGPGHESHVARQHTRRRTVRSGLRLRARPALRGKKDAVLVRDNASAGGNGGTDENRLITGLSDVLACHYVPEDDRLFVATAGGITIIDGASSAAGSVAGLSHRVLTGLRSLGWTTTGRRIRSILPTLSVGMSE